MKVALSTLFVLGMVASGTARAANPVVVIETSMGTIKAELFEDKAPITVKNFLSYVDDKHYDGTIIHRVIKGFMVQGGGYTTDKKLKDTKAPIKNEWQTGLSNTRGTIAMARTNDPDSATDQFFINVVDNTRLDKPNPELGMTAGYTAFGKVIEGMDVADKISAANTDVAQIEMKTRTGEKVMAPTRDVPVENIAIKSIRRADK